MKFIFLWLILVLTFAYTYSGRIREASELDGDDSIELVTRRQNHKGVDEVLQPANDALFGFIDKMINTGYLSSKMALKRVRSQSDTTKQIEDQIETLLEKLPNFKVPLFDDFNPTNVEVQDH